MTYPELLKQKQLILLDCISGSQAYNLALPGSDIDKKGIFILPKKELYGFTFCDQVSSEKNDEVYFDIKRFLDLMAKNNPNILELLSTPPEYICYRHPLMDLIKPADFLSKLCLDSFAGYAQTQIKKAQGLNKKINKPIGSRRKTVLDFCYVIRGNNSIPLTKWLSEKKLDQEYCGLTKVEHFRDGYLLFDPGQAGPALKFKGIVSGPKADTVQLSSIAKDLEPAAVMNFNKDGYSTYCREYKEYNEWEKERNEARYESTLAHGKSYDAKNMMHTFRLLHMAEEIALYKKINVHRPDRDFLLRIRAGEFEFDDLMNMVAEKMEKIKTLFETSDLPDQPDFKKTEQILVEIRETYYNQQH
jgi:predicted nucleotidyltransferase